jgi:serine/threonine-protein kinase RsbW
MKLPATIENLRYFLQHVSHCASRMDFTRERLNEIELAVEEALVNIIRYAYPTQTGYIEVKCDPVNGCGIEIVIEDEGISFDIQTLPDPDLSANLMSRKTGGLGVFFIRKMTNEVRYHRDGKRNVLTLVVYPERCSLSQQAKYTSIQAQ